jgi:hypothetical protein
MGPPGLCDPRGQLGCNSVAACDVSPFEPVIATPEARVSNVAWCAKLVVPAEAAFTATVLTEGALALRCHEPAASRSPHWQPHPLTQERRSTWGVVAPD